MASTYDPDLCAKLIAKARERHAATGRVWTGDALDLADQLEAAQREVEHWREARRAAIEAGEVLKAQRDEALADGVLSQRVCDIENDRAQLTAERDRLQADVKRLTARLALESAALEQACAVDINNPITVTEALDRAIDAYRAARKAGGS